VEKAGAMAAISTRRLITIGVVAVLAAGLFLTFAVRYAQDLQRRPEPEPPSATTAPPSTTAALPDPVFDRPPSGKKPRTRQPVDLPDGLFCRDLRALGYDFGQAVRYWEAQGQPDRMDEDGDGIPCETVYANAGGDAAAG
jgi:Excalibur calcium-binding domain